MSHDTKLPLHGLPVAIKDDHDVEGLDSTLGFAKNLYKPAAESAVLIKTLIKLGAVPFLKTNVPQSLLSNGEDNPIFGTTLNSWNTKLAPGGSSSGSASIVAAGNNKLRIIELFGYVLINRACLKAVLHLRLEVTLAVLSEFHHISTGCALSGQL